VGPAPGSCCLGSWSSPATASGVRFAGSPSRPPTPPPPGRERPRRGRTGGPGTTSPGLVDDSRREAVLEAGSYRPRRVAPAQAEVTLGGPGLCPGGPVASAATGNVCPVALRVAAVAQEPPIVTE
jgi:hypothetical protein